MFEKKRGFPLILALLSGGIAALAFPPFPYGGEPIWCALIPLLWVVRRSTPKAAFWRGFVAGLLFWSISLCWFPAIVKNNGPWPLVLLGWAGLAGWCALFWGAFGFLSAKGWSKLDAAPSIHRIGMVVVFDPLLWMGLEWVRTWLFTGFAWNFLGVSQAENPPILQIASLVGVYGVSGLILLANGALTSLAERMVGSLSRKVKGMQEERRESFLLRLMGGAESAIPFLFVMGVWLWGGMRVARFADEHPQRSEWRVALVQPNAPCVFEQDRERTRRQFEVLRDQTQLANLSRPDLVVWPETAMPGSMPGNPNTLRFLRMSMGTNGAPLLAGCAETRREEDGDRFYNSAYLVTAQGETKGIYRKQHLVPFGEYIPFDKSIPILQRLAPTGVSCHPGEGPNVMYLQRGKERLRIGALICFEDTIPALSRNAAKAGANLLALMTNDAWFNFSCEPLQHQFQAVFRSVETGLPMVRAANSGVSCVVSPVGVVKRLEADGAVSDFHGFFSARVLTETERRLTGYTRWGDFPLAILFLFAILFLYWQGKKRRGS